MKARLMGLMLAIIAGLALMGALLLGVNGTARAQSVREVAVTSPEAKLLTDPAQTQVGGEVAAQGTFTPTWNTERVDGDKIFGCLSDRSLALDSSGHPHIVYGWDSLYYAWHDGTSWHRELVDIDGGERPAMRLDSGGHSHIAYAGQKGLKYAWYDGISWYMQTVASGGSYSYVSLVLDGSGHPYISCTAWQSIGSGNLMYAHYDGHEWNIQTVDNVGFSGQSTSLALDSTERPHIGYCARDVNKYPLRYAQLGTGTWLTQTVDDTGYCDQVSLVLDDDDKVHIGYESMGLKYAHWTGSTWISETMGVGGGQFPSLALDASGNPHLSYYTSYNLYSFIVHAYHDGSAWQQEFIDWWPWSEGSPASTSLALDGSDNPHITYVTDRTDGDLKYASDTGSGWGSQTVDSSRTMRQSVSVALGVEGELHICYHDAHDRSLKYARLSSMIWYSETVDNSADVGEGCSLALGAAGYPHISYYDATHDTLKYADYNGAAWISQTVESVFYVMDSTKMRTSLALDAADIPHIAYYEYYYAALKHAWVSGTTWYSETVDSSSDVGQGGVGLYVSLALDGSGDPRISYYDEVSSALKYARWTGTDWITETVDSTVEAGEYNSLALDSSGHPHISYYDATNSALKYAHWTGTTWVSETVDNSGSVGTASSLALDSSERPHISYYESHWSDPYLKYAYWTGSAWVSQTVASAAAFYTSLVLDGSNYPHIGYYDNCSGDLHYAWQARQATISTGGGTLGPFGKVSFAFPGGAVTDTIVITYTALQPTGSRPHAGVFFDITAVYQSDGQPAQIASGQTYTIVVNYDEDALPAGVSESDLALYYWDGSEWVKEPTSVVDTIANTITATPDHFSVWAALAESGYEVYLPLVLRNY